MINFTFEKKVSDIPMILPVEMFIVEEETAAPEFKQEINEIVPTFQEEVQEQPIITEQPDIIEEIVAEEAVEAIPVTEPIQEVITPEIVEPVIQTESETVIVDSVTEEASEFVIEEVVQPEEQKPQEETPPIVENDFEIKLKQKPEPKEIPEPLKDIEIAVKKKPNKKSFNVSTVLKNLENQDQDFKKEQEASEVQQEEVFTENVSASMTISEIDLLRQQLYSCLTIPAGAKALKDLKVLVNIEVNPDRTIKNAILVNKERSASDKYFRTAAEAAMRAVNNPECSPLKLPEDKYDQWKEINFTFDFSWMFE